MSRRKNALKQTIYRRLRLIMVNITVEGGVIGMILRLRLRDTN